MGSKAMAQKKASKPSGRTSAELPSTAQTWRGRPVELQGKRLRLESVAVAEGSAPGSGASGLCLATGGRIGKTRLHLESGAVAEGGSQECAPGLCLATGSKVRGSAGTPSARRAKAPTTSAAGPTACAGPSGSGSAGTPSARGARAPTTSAAGPSAGTGTSAATCNGEKEMGKSKRTVPLTTPWRVTKARLPLPKI